MSLSFFFFFFFCSFAKLFSVPPRSNYWVCPGPHLLSTSLFTTWNDIAGSIPAPHITRFVVRSDELPKSKMWLIHHWGGEAILIASSILQIGHWTLLAGQRGFFSLHLYCLLFVVVCCCCIYFYYYSMDPPIINLSDQALEYCSGLLYHHICL